VAPTRSNPGVFHVKINIMKSKLEIHSLWSLRRVQGAEFSVYVNSIPDHPDEEVRNLFYSPSMPDLKPGEFGLSSDEVELVYSEIAGTPEYIEAVDGLPRIGRPSIHRFAVSRRVNDTWLKTKVIPGTLHVTLTPRVGSRDLDYREFDLQIAKLSGATRRIVKRLDIGTQRIAQFRYEEARAQLEEVEGIELPGARREKVFISYRHADGIDLAKLVHEQFESYGNCAYFEPFLDLHELRRGDWAQLILKALNQAVIFIPILTTDYAPEGSFSLQELEMALEKTKDGTLHIAPVFVDGQKNRWVDNLKGFHGCILRTESTWESAIDKLLDVLARR